MSLARLLSKPCTLTYRTESGADEYNNPTYTESTVDSVCYYEQRFQDERTVDRDTQIEELKVLLPADTTIPGLAAVTIDELSHELFGPPWVVWNPRTREAHHVECRTRRTR